MPEPRTRRANRLAFCHFMPPATERKETRLGGSSGLERVRRSPFGQTASQPISELRRGFVLPQGRPDETGDPGCG